jgi:hypothetical protein
MTIRTLRTLRFLAGLAVALTVGSSSAAAQASPLDDMLSAAKRSLEVLDYRKADSISRSVLAFGSVLSKPQRVLALQILIGAAYPEDKPNERQTDTARARIKELLAVDAQAWDRNLTWDQLDTLRALVVRASAPGKIVLGSRTPNAFLFINNQPQGILGSLKIIELPPDMNVPLSIRAERCTPFDTVVRVRANDSVVVGRRNLTCTP